MDSKKSSLMVLSDHYLTFVKDQTECIASEFRQINICIRHNSIAELSNYLPINCLKPFRSRSIKDLSALPENISVHSFNLPYLPIDLMRKKLGNRFFRAVDKLLQNEQNTCDLIHAHFLWPNGYAGALLKEKYGIPLVVTAHGYDIYDLPFRDQEWRDRIVQTLEAADAVITVSKRNEECIRSLGVTKPVHVIPNGFRSDLFHPRDQTECREALGLPLNRKIVLTVGNLVEVKGHCYLVEAIADMNKNHPDTFCVIIGSGSLKGKLERQVRSLGLMENVLLVGGKPHEEIPLWMNACDIIVLPSLNEGNPTVMFESLGCGKPFIGTDVGGIPEIITSDQYGLVVKPGDAQDLADALTRALSIEWNREAIREYAEQFTWDAIANDVLDVYSHALDNR